MGRAYPSATHAITLRSGCRFPQRGELAAETRSDCFERSAALAPRGHVNVTRLISRIVSRKEQRTRAQMKISEAVWQDSGRLCGAVCVPDTHIPVSVFFEYLEQKNPRSSCLASRM